MRARGVHFGRRMRARVCFLGVRGALLGACACSGACFGRLLEHSCFICMLGRSSMATLPPPLRFESAETGVVIPVPKGTVVGTFLVRHLLFPVEALIGITVETRNHANRVQRRDATDTMETLLEGELSWVDIRLKHPQGEALTLGRLTK